MISIWKQAGLIKPSVIKPIFTTIEKSLVLKKLGRLGQDDRRVLKETLQTVLSE
jgi:mRNA interferase MazF